MTRTFLMKAAAVTLLVAAGGFMTGTYAVSWEPHRPSRPPHHGPDHKRLEQQAVRDAVKRGEVMPLPKILTIAQKAVPGDVLEVELEQESWGLKYELKILTAAGVVRKVDLNARTGAVVKIKDD